MLIVHQLSGILFNMDTFNANGFARSVRVFLVKADLDLPLAHNRVIELRNLIALRQIGIEIILPVKARPAVNLRANRHSRADGLTYAFAV